ncbi:predicted protein [Naegleria gruberi]|uniref:Predicted protein n=1 Tax=Naegleria gruberi TaxID=5762 RepID=D2UZC2_NAEGR|nr:uncharacterized protein NAEGRDRAFT_45440 [Naegleria gruberi]EFC50123.1 predicted protein [Naegleria gruberi]|eukprot:XP_002682867.1 predicted protein [Naegleria gruberi strain NEG-M]
MFLFDLLTIHPHSFDKQHHNNEHSQHSDSSSTPSSTYKIPSSTTPPSDYSKRRRLVQLLSHLKPIKNQELRTKILNKLKENKIDLLDHHLFKISTNAPILHNLFSHNINSNERIKAKYYNEYDSQILLHPFQSVNKLTNFIKSVYNVLEMVDEDDHHNMKLLDKENSKKEKEKKSSSVGFDLPIEEEDDPSSKQNFNVNNNASSNTNNTVYSIDKMLFKLFNASSNSDGIDFNEKSSENEKIKPEYYTTIDRPITSSMIILFVEILLNIIKSLAILTLLTVTYVHDRFNFFIKPIIVIELSKLENHLSDLMLNFRKYFRIGTNAKLTVARLLAKIRNNNPKNFYMILSVYLRMKNLMQIPKSFVNQLFWTITSIYLNILLFCIFIFEKIASPKLLHLIYMSNDKFLEILNNLLTFVNHYYKNVIENDQFINLKKHETDLDNKFYSQPLQGTEN